MSIQSRADRFWDKLRNVHHCPVIGLSYVVPDAPAQDDNAPTSEDSPESGPSSGTESAPSGWELVLREGTPKPQWSLTGSGAIPDRCPHCGRRFRLDGPQSPDDHPLWTMQLSPDEWAY